MVRLGLERRARSQTQRRKRSPFLDDPEQFAEVLSTTRVSEIAADLGVPVALKRHGIQSPWRYEAWTRLEIPPDTEIVRAWEAEETITGVARR
jgi:hypothetical protein